LKYFTLRPRGDYDGKFVVNDFRKNKPATKEDVQEMGLKLRPIGEGAFREVYQIKGCNLVVKIPMSEYDASTGSPLKDYHSEHSQEEMLWYTKIMRNYKYKKLRKYMPEIYYYHENGLILMKKYRKFHYGCNYRRINILEQILNDIFNFILRENRNWRDLNNTGNIGIDNETDQLVILDLGCFGG